MASAPRRLHRARLKFRQVCLADSGKFEFLLLVHPDPDASPRESTRLFTSGLWVRAHHPRYVHQGYGH